MYMRRKELIDLLNQAERNLILEKNERHREMLTKIVTLYRDTLKKDRGEQADRRMREWIRESLKDF